MANRGLKLLRVGVALAVGAVLTAALVDFRGFLPPAAGRWLASIQLVPSAIALATGAALSLACLVVLAATLLGGRIYCSVICPLGILQDVIARVATWVRRGGRRFLPHAPPWTRLRWLIFWATVGGVASGWASLTLSLEDPYSSFGRIAADGFRPLAVLVNNAVAGLANLIGVGTLYRVPVPWAGAAAAHQPILLLVLLVVLVAWRGRLYCNTLCPVGTLLGWLARRAAFRLTIDARSCNKCIECLHVCKAQCIDLRRRNIDFSRCVACYNCLDVCPNHGISYRFAWVRPAGAQPAAPPLQAATAAVPDPQRRAFLADSAVAVAALLGAPALRAQGAPSRTVSGAGASSVLCPPGAVSVERFWARCTACHLCLPACPTQVLQPAFLESGWAGLMKPRLDYTRGACTYSCRACLEVCPDGALDRLELAEKQVTRIGLARLDLDRCIVKTKGTDCAACSEQCPTQAVTTAPYGRNLRLPRLDPELCTGCGGCEFACPVQPVKAITVTGLRRHERARRPVDAKAAAPAPAGGFPF
ncbi:MAG TPA: 4Fe-4S dicluster domain-containing protein [Opitutaceae bacterium]|nr:4Fe-4S dicluster domain-containing protein [Opitutaceae bacterium]